MKEGSYVEPSF